MNARVRLGRHHQVGGTRSRKAPAEVSPGNVSMVAHALLDLVDSGRWPNFPASALVVLADLSVASRMNSASGKSRRHGVGNLDEFGVKSDEMCAETLGEGDRAVDQVIGLLLTLHDGKHRFVGHGEPPSYGCAPI